MLVCSHEAGVLHPIPSRLLLEIATRPGGNPKTVALESPLSGDRRRPLALVPTARWAVRFYCGLGLLRYFGGRLLRPECWRVFPTVGLNGTAKEQVKPVARPRNQSKHAAIATQMAAFPCHGPANEGARPCLLPDVNDSCPHCPICCHNYRYLRRAADQ